jgi:hypothetical protein
MRLRKIVTGLLIASTLGMSVPAMAEEVFVKEGNGFWLEIVLGLTAAGLVTYAIVDSGKSG